MKAKEQGKDITRQRGAKKLKKLKISKAEDRQEHSANHRSDSSAHQKFQKASPGKIQLGDEKCTSAQRQMDWQWQF